MKRAHAAPALLSFGLILLGSTAFTTRPARAADDPFQRHIVFRNELEMPIFPVVQAPQDKNCGIGGLLRIVVNDQKEGAGVPAGKTVKLTIPKDKPCPQGAFYDAVRIYILVGKKDGERMVEQFEALLSNVDQRTTRDTAWNTELCGGHACWVGSAKADYGHDAPGQLLEYTIVSQNPADGAKFPDPNDTRGIPFIDFDVSYVDDATFRSRWPG